MVRALASQNIDVAILWSVWPETFSFTAHEALAAGTVIVTSEDSGNSADRVRRFDRGIVFESEAAAISAFQADDIEELARGRTNGNSSIALTWGNVSADVLLAR